jgi:hypothetical protein
MVMWKWRKVLSRENDFGPMNRGKQERWEW